MNRDGFTMIALLVSIALAALAAVALDRLRDHTAARPQPITSARMR